MRRHHRANAAAASFAKGNGAPVPDAISLIRTFNSETNPSRPIRPSPLTASPIQGMPLDVLDRIRSFPLFLSAPESFLAAIGAHLRPQSHSPHDYILTEGDDAKAMYWLVRGAVAVTSRDGESTYAELKPGAFFGEIGILMDIPRTATIVARTRCLLVVLKKEDLTKLLPEFPEVERAIREEAQERLSILERKKRERIAQNALEPGHLQARGEKRARDGEESDVVMGDTPVIRPNSMINTRKRKSPSPSIVDVAASSALGSGLVHVRQLLRELPLFSGLPGELLHFLGLNAQQCTYPPFTDIIQQGSLGREVFFIVRGEVEVIDEKGSIESRRLSNGTGRDTRRGLQVKARLRQGQYFGEVASLSLAPRRTATVRSVTSVECLMITGEVLGEFWTRCPPKLRHQVEKTAKERLHSKVDEDIVMFDATDSSTPPIDELAIGERPTKRKQSVPTFSYTKPESPHKPSRIEDRPVIEPLDPDPFLNTDLDQVRSRSRRSSIAPFPPEGQQADDKRIIPKTMPTKLRHSSTPPTPPETQSMPKRPKTITRKTSEYRKGTLPDKILISIFSYLDLHDLMRLRIISWHWSKLLKESPELITTLNLAMYNRRITDEVLIKQICPFAGNRPRHIDISNCFHLTDEGFTALASACGATARSWKMKSVWDITPQAINEMVTNAKELEEVDLSNCRKVSDTLLARVVGWVVEGPSTQINQYSNGRRGTVRTPNSHNVPIGTVYGCPKLKKLTLSYCKHVTDRSMAHLAAYAHARLEEIDLTRCTTITDQGFQQWGQSQKPFFRLRKLCLADCTYLTDHAIVYLTNAAKGLRDLDLVSLKLHATRASTY
ncbi:MAG: hypothetical protein MMC33_008618 [Icmadophila ericetorum]|nr:hypothetical protein [Icmadophila ericetorum]